MKILYVKLIFMYESTISHVKYIFRILTYHMRNFEPTHFTCEVGISCVKTFMFLTEIKASYVEIFQFHIFFTCEMT